MAETRLRQEELRQAQERLKALEGRRSDLQQQVEGLERLRAAPDPRRLLLVAAKAESLGLTVEEMTMSGRHVTVVYRAPTAEAARRLRDELERSGVIGSPSLDETGGTFTLTAELRPANGSS